jgi:predicted ribosomally synthesized peptide with nif11-like leader
MSEEQLKDFLEAVKADSGLKEQLTAASDPFCSLTSWK